MFEIGNYVIYRAEGVCRISDIRNENFGSIGIKEKYYILTPLNDEKSTVFVPVANDRLVGMMRRLLSADEINALSSSIKNDRLEWIPEARARNNAFRDILAIGDRRDLIILVNTICDRLESLKDQGKKITSTDENALKKAIRLLFEEFSATTDISSEDDVIAVLRGELILASKDICMNA